MNAKPPGDNDAEGQKPGPFVDPDEPTRMVTPEMRPADASDSSRTSGATSGTATGTGTFGDLEKLADGPVQVLQEGDTLKERFVLEARLGTGGMGTVYKALDLRKQEAEDRNPYIAVKILNEDFRAHPESLRTLQRESKKAQSLAHPSIVTVYDFDRDGTSIYMTMEYLEGKPLDKITKSGGFKGLPLDQALEIIQDVGAALAFAHKQGIVHCDFKPGNIFITDTGPAKVIDFGIARAVKLGDDPQADATVFDAGSLGALTPAYASPEMLEDEEPDPRDDVYALACISYELISGRHPFGRMPATEARDNALVPKQPPELNRRQWKALAAGLAFDRGKRIADVETFVSELSAGGENRRALRLVAAVAGVAILAGGGFYFSTNETEEAASSGSGIVAQSDSGNETPGAASQPGTLAPAEVAPEPADPAPEASAEAVSPEPEVTVQGEADAAPEVTQEPERVQEALIPPVRFTAEDIDELVRRASCADIRHEIEGGSISVTGYSGSMAEINLLRDEIGNLSGVENTRFSVGLLDGALCAPLEVFTPYVRKNREENTGLTIRTRNEDGVYVENESLIVDMKLPGYESYVYVDYYSIDGGVLHILPNEAYPENLGSADLDVTLGEDDSVRSWTIAAPFGTELVVVLTSPEPLFGVQREEVEFASSYLPDLRARLDELARGADANRLSADIFFITTTPAR
ncbi:serine/threonine protein kinase [Denitrobaculum tricleocarpae]|uniref:Protein kinase n=1 Tax=Denitrobaculum tricleocarpae TaxID=2591009 RepID=A0A545TTG6_9PROT|nr:serine/threonine protein kinase [Denitrobaculum tricleocarpae]TQV80441.1 protein kinase [Denitrobaculum tricleocarpae]